MPSSNAISSSNVSAVVGYLLAKGYFNPNSPNLPQNISILAEANTDNQSGLSTNGVLITSAKQVAILAGYGSPAHIIARILFPQTGQGVTIPVTLYLQAAAVSSVAKVMTLTPTGTATAAGTIYLNIAGRQVVDGATYAINVAVGDTPTQQCDKMRVAIAAALSCPVIGSGTSTLVATAKWTGLTSQDITLTVDTNGTSTGTTYAVVETTAGAGTPAVSASLALFGNEWKTIVINSYGLVSATMTELEAYNGKPDPVNPTGQYGGTIMRPMWALSGTVLDNPTSITSAGVRPDNVTIVPCVAPLSAGMAMEAAANVAFIIGNIFQNKPNSSPLNQAYPDMPPPPTGSIPAMVSYTVRDSYVKLGCSTVDFVNGTYIIKDLVTTYNVAGEFPPFYRYVRDLNVHFNFKFRYHLREQQELVGKQLANDDDVVTASDVIKPKMWKAEIIDLIEGAVRDGLLVDAAFSIASIDTGINSSNPNRMDTLFDVKISGVAYQSATTVKGGFNFGN